MRSRPGAPPLFSQTTISLLAAGGGLLLLSMLAYPMGYDQAAFLVGGDMIFTNGAVPYRDFIDTKPPIIFYLYGLASFLFGHNEWGIRLFDALLTAAAIYYLHKILLRHTSQFVSIVAPGLYLVFYVGSGYWYTAQAESFALLPSLAILDLTLRLRSANAARHGILVGALTGILLLLKFTLVTYTGGILLWLLLDRTHTKTDKIRFGLAAACGFGIVVAVYLLQLSLAGGFERFVQSIQWVQGYSALEPLTDPVTWSKQIYLLSQQIIAFTFTLSFLFFTAIGLFEHVRRDEVASVPRQTFSLMLFGFVGHMVGVYFERKFFPYHFTRAMWLITPFVAIGIFTLMPVIRRRWNDALAIGGVQGFARAIVLGGLLFVLVFFSPFLRLATQSARWMALRLTGGDVAASVQNFTDGYYYRDQKLVAAALGPMLGPTDQVFVWGNGVGIYQMLDRLPTTIVLTSTPFRTAWTPPEWQGTMMEQLHQSSPRFLIIEHGDAKLFITGSEDDSKQAFERIEPLRHWRDNHYRYDQTIGHFHVYERRVAQR